MAGHDYVTQADLNAKMNRPNDTVWSFQHNVDGTLDQAGLGVKGAVDDFFSCASISDGSGKPVISGASEPGCDHLRSVMVAYGSQGSQLTADVADDWPRSWYVRK